MKKQTFVIIVAVVFIAAMFIFGDTATLPEIISWFAAAGGLIAGVWNWISKKEIIKEKDEKIRELQWKFDQIWKAQKDQPVSVKE